MRRTIGCIGGVVALILGGIIPCSLAYAATIHVPGDAPTIQGGLNMSAPGDTILVAPGIYYENLAMFTARTLIGAGGPDVTIVDGKSLGPVILADGDQSFSVIGLTLRNGSMSQFPGGAGVSMLDASGSFEDCVFTDNETHSRDGGGISVAGSIAFIRDCVFEDNIADPPAGMDGGAVFAWGATLVLENCFIADNLASEGGGIAITNGTNATIRGNVVVNNEATATGVGGGGMVAALSDLLVESNTFAGNTSLLFSGCLGFHGCSVELHGNIIANSSGNGIHCTTPIINSCNDVWNSGNVDYFGCAPGPGGFSADPQFCSPELLDFTLRSSSPCAAENSPAGCGLIGALDVGCGPIAVEPATWGRIKATYRR